MEQIDLKEPNKAGRDKTEQLKISLFVQELSRSSSKSNFLQYWSEIATHIFGETRLVDFHMELSKRLKLSNKLQLVISLSLLDNNHPPESVYAADCLNLFKNKLVEYAAQNKMEPLEEYVVHRIMFIVRCHPAYKNTWTLHDALRVIVDANQAKLN